MNGVDPFLRRESCVRSLAVHNKLGFAYAFARGLEQTLWAERRFEHENGVTAARLGFEQFARRFGANLFVGRPKKDDSFSRRYFRRLERFEGEERLDNASFHIKDARAENPSAANGERHFAERAGRVDGVIVTENKQLARGSAGRWPPFDADVIAASLLTNQIDADVSFAPLGGNEFAATVGGAFFCARRFGERKFTQDAQHLGQPGAEGLQKFLGIQGEFWHGVMLAIEARFGNFPREIARLGVAASLIMVVSAGALRDRRLHPRGGETE